MRNRGHMIASPIPAAARDAYCGRRMNAYIPLVAAPVLQSLPAYTWIAQSRNADMPATNRTDPRTRITARKESGGTIMWGRKNAASQRVAAARSSASKNGLKTA